VTILNADELRKLPYVANPPGPDRAVSLRSFWDDQSREWVLFIDVEPGQLGRIRGGETALGGYFGRVPYDSVTDLEFPIATLISQYLSFPDATEISAALENDANHLAAVIEKYRIVSHLRTIPGIAATTLIATELEYLLFLSRSMYDLVQELAKRLGNRIVRLDNSVAKVVKNLPPSFRKVALEDTRLRSAAEIQERFGLPPQLAQFYAAEAPLFAEIRALRDSIGHRGKELPHTFPIAKGFGVDHRARPWSAFPLWSSSPIIEERFGSLRALFAFLAHHVIGVTTRFAEAFSMAVQLPPAISHDVKVFLRSPFGRHLVALPQIIADPWEGDPNPQPYSPRGCGPTSA
jgi:hypothetical protein